MALSFEDFQRVWRESREDQSDHIAETAWKRYQQVQLDSHVTKPVEEEPSLEELKAAFKPILALMPETYQHKFITLPASNIPWTPTGIFVEEDQAVSVFSTGRTWRSKLLDLYLPPKYNLWFRIGINGSIFNSTHDTKTFMCMEGQSGQELFLANQYPGAFSDKEGGRVGGDLSAYEKAEGAFQVVIVVWNPGLSIHYDIRKAFQELLRPNNEDKPNVDPYGLMSIGMERLSSDYIIHQYPRGWVLLWFLGQSMIFFQEQDGITEEDLAASHQLEPVPETQKLDTEVVTQDPPSTCPMIRCLPSLNVGILQKDLIPCFPLSPNTTASWVWNIIDLPSRLREDTSFSHDYLSIAFEFENGRDITYTWSWELPVGFGYWCPLAAWRDREYHVVLRSGTEGLRHWHKEQRNLHRDYVEYINKGDETRPVPTQVTRVWLIAGNRWQRHRGEMLIKRIRLGFEEDGSGDTQQEESLDVL